jgi:hypothetical protein
MGGKMKRLVVVAAIAFSGCQANNVAVTATPVPTDIYVGYSCARLKTERAEAAQTIGSLSSNRNAALAAASVEEIVVGVPLTPFVAGDANSRIGELNARIALLDAVMAQRKCAAS